MIDIAGKTILILGGANVHVKVVEAAHALGLRVIVTDYLDEAFSPAKRIADEYWNIDITHVDKIVEQAKKSKIDAVLSCFLDPGQRPYYEICQRLGVPCYIDTWEQVFTLTDKDAFKGACKRNGVDIIETFDKECIKQYPVLIKPAHSRGSRGQSVCYNSDQVDEAIEFAEKESDNHEAIIERYMGNKDDFTMTYFFINGNPFLMRTADRLLGEPENNLAKVAMAEVSPSVYHDLFTKKINSKVIAMLRDLGIKNGPVFMQGFIDGEKLRLYDPGYRFPGTEFDLLFTKATGIDLTKLLVYFSVTGEFCKDFGLLSQDMSKLGNKICIELWPCVRPGVIGKIKGLDTIGKDPSVLCYTLRHYEGEQIENYGNVNQRLAEIDMIADSRAQLKEKVEMVHRMLEVISIEGEDQIFNRLCPEKVLAQ